MIPLWNIFCVSWGSFIWVLYPKWLPPNNGDDNLTYNGCGLLAYDIMFINFIKKEKGKWGILTFHNTIWNAAMVVKLDMYRMNWIVLWGEPLRWIYVQSVILLNYTGKKDSSNIWMKLYFPHKHNISEYHFIQRVEWWNSSVEIM